ncbi:hypothetical protein GWI33_003082 [Rhynchophorus ferrugineus]|uniref:Uncharacterized protein n=1 Tax=Rhynchophorus ferrugineus TaxID=354439 RepID=A0A834INA1_RHYFE|nr:hypothetical protein GWI33_003082 [Rhynchophorus ferrugineus]
MLVLPMIPAGHYPRWATNQTPLNHDCWDRCGKHTSLHLQSHDREGKRSRDRWSCEIEPSASDTAANCVSTLPERDAEPDGLAWINTPEQGSIRCLAGRERKFHLDGFGDGLRIIKQSQNVKERVFR